MPCLWNQAMNLCFKAGLNTKMGNNGVTYYSWQSWLYALFISRELSDADLKCWYWLKILSLFFLLFVWFLCCLSDVWPAAALSIYIIMTWFYTSSTKTHILKFYGVYIWLYFPYYLAFDIHCLLIIAVSAPHLVWLIY